MMGESIRQLWFKSKESNERETIYISIAFCDARKSSTEIWRHCYALNFTQNIPFQYFGV